MEENKEQNSENNYLVPGAIIVAGVLIAGAVMYSTGANLRGPAPLGKGPVAPAPGESVDAGGFRGDLTDDDPMLGSPDAPVTMVEFSDFQCPFCRLLWQDTLPQIKEKYIKTGKVRFVYRDFPLAFHEMAQKYAEAGECADDQGKFWQMHDKIFEEQAKRGTGTITGITVTDLKQWGREIGLDGVTFDSCLDSGKYKAEVEKDQSDGQAAGVSGTPGTFVNGRLIPGALPYVQFEVIIEEELKKK